MGHEISWPQTHEIIVLISISCLATKTSKLETLCFKSLLLLWSHCKQHKPGTFCMFHVFPSDLWSELLHLSHLDLFNPSWTFINERNRETRSIKPYPDLRVIINSFFLGQGSQSQTFKNLSKKILNTECFSWTQSHWGEVSKYFPFYSLNSLQCEAPVSLLSLSLSPLQSSPHLLVP